ncbi:MAG: hypothetical protein KJ941_03920 [Bacteroidetes bacterium]|nr:hypothetical protein [Bacteroidota bacterium]
METNKTVGIIGLGWLGASLANNLNQLGYSVWGTQTQSIPRFVTDEHVKSIRWKHEDGLEQLIPLLKSSKTIIVTIPPSKFEAINYKTLMEDIVKNSDNETKFIYTSSIGIYPRSKGAFNESAEVDRQSNLYLAEQAFLSYSPSQSVILRLGGLIGNDRNPVHYLVKKENDDPDGKVHLIDKIDVIGAILQSITLDKTGVWNVVNPENVSRKVYYTKMAQHLGLPKPHFNQKVTGLTERKIISTKFIEDFDYKSFRPLLEFD